MSPASIGPVKAMLLSLDAGEISAFVADLLAQKTGVSSLRQELRAFAEAKGVPL
jgi:phosphotransferase system enzyme I (PtsP)